MTFYDWNSDDEWHEFDMSRKEIEEAAAEWERELNRQADIIRQFTHDVTHYGHFLCMSRKSTLPLVIDRGVLRYGRMPIIDLRPSTVHEDLRNA